jgi:hypothetical protein
MRIDPGAFAWGGAPEARQESAFFEGSHLVDRLVKSSFGRFMEVIKELSADLGDGSVSADSFVLPRVVVVGAESAGKSSLLESLTKAAIFPRDAKTCTKMPIRVCLGPPDKELREQATVTAGGQSWHVPKEEILERVSEVMAKMGPDELSEAEIVVTVRAEGFPTFELIDLPGECLHIPCSSLWRWQVVLTRRVCLCRHP